MTAALALEPAGAPLCWHCRVTIDGAAASPDPAHQRRLLRFLNLKPFHADTRGPVCVWHALLTAAPRTIHAH